MDQYSLNDFFRENARQSNQILNLISMATPEQDYFLDKQDYDNGFGSMDLKPVTKMIQKADNNKRGYITTPNEIRLELIDSVFNSGEKINHAAKRLGIKYSAAKSICQIYKREGRSDRIIAKRSKAKELRIQKQNSDSDITPSEAKDKHLEGEKLSQALEKSHLTLYAQPKFTDLQEIQPANSKINETVPQITKYPHAPHYYSQLHKVLNSSATESLPVSYLNQNFEAPFFHTGLQYHPSFLNASGNLLYQGTFLPGCLPFSAPPLQMGSNFPNRLFYVIPAQPSNFFGPIPQMTSSGEFYKDPMTYTRLLQPEEEIQTYNSSETYNSNSVDSYILS